jgi:VWFA-related protein
MSYINLRRWLACAAFIWLAVLLPASPNAQNQQQPRPVDQNIVRIGSEEVLLDIVARDKRGRPVNDLKAEEIEVYEDGVKQAPTSFRRIEKTSFTSAASPAATTPGAKPGVTATVDPLRQINLVTLVFERLNQESRPLAREAATEFLKSQLGDNTMIAVFTLDQRMQILQQFTNDQDKLKQAIELALGNAASQFAEKSEAIRTELENYTKATTALDNASGNAQAAGGGAIAAAAVQAKLAEIAINTMRMVDDAQRQQQGNASLYSLLALVREQKRLAGRKTVLFFSEGLKLTPALVETFRRTISDANRANVSFYAVDARGLVTARQTDAARESLQAAVKANEQQMRSRGNQPLTAEQVKAWDNAESSLVKNGQENLASLAESTGGFLIANTNDLRTPMRRIALELASYYEVSYAPPIREADGKFHAVTVKTTRPDVVLQTRNGYFALPPTETGAPVTLPYEMPLLAVLSETKPARAFEHRAAALHFATEADRVQHALVMDVPMGALKFDVDEAKKQFRAHFALLALIKDSSGAIVQKFSKDQILEGQADKLDSLLSRSYVYENDLWLPPGRYTLETVVHDRNANKLSPRRAVLVVPAAKTALRMSSITVVKRVNPPTNVGAVNSGDASNKESASPLQLSEGRIIPNLGDTIFPTAGAQLSFYFVVYPGAGLNEKPRLTLEFLQDGEVIARATPELGSADAQGRIPYITALPMEQFKGGMYEVRAVIRQGQSAVEEHAFFNVHLPSGNVQK